MSERGEVKEREMACGEQKQIEKALKMRTGVFENWETGLGQPSTAEGRPG